MHKLKFKELSIKRAAILFNLGVVLLGSPIGNLLASEPPTNIEQLTEDKINNKLKELRNYITELRHLALLNSESNANNENCYNLQGLLKIFTIVHDQLESTLHGLANWVTKSQLRVTKNELESIKDITIKNIVCTLKNIAHYYQKKLNDKHQDQTKALLAIYSCFINNKPLSNDLIKNAVLSNQDTVTALQSLARTLDIINTNQIANTQTVNSKAKKIIDYLAQSNILLLEEHTPSLPVFYKGQASQREKMQEIHNKPWGEEKLNGYSEILKELLEKPSALKPISVDELHNKIKPLRHMLNITETNFAEIENIMRRHKGNVSSKGYNALLSQIITEKFAVLVHDLENTRKRIEEKYTLLTLRHGNTTPNLLSQATIVRSIKKEITDFINRLTTNYAIQSYDTQQALISNSVITTTKNKLFILAEKFKNTLENYWQELLKYAHLYATDPEIANLVQAINQFTDTLKFFVDTLEQLNLLFSKANQ